MQDTLLNPGTSTATANRTAKFAADGSLDLSLTNIGLTASTDDLPEGGTNEYFTADRAVAALQNATLDGLNIVSNLHVGANSELSDGSVTALLIGKDDNGGFNGTPFVFLYDANVPGMRLDDGAGGDVPVFFSGRFSGQFDGSYSGTIDGSNVTGSISAGQITGTLSVPHGGTGATTFTAGRVLLGNGVSVVTTSANLTYDTTNNALTVKNFLLVGSGALISNLNLSRETVYIQNGARVVGASPACYVSFGPSFQVMQVGVLDGNFYGFGTISLPQIGIGFDSGQSFQARIQTNSSDNAALVALTVNTTVTQTTGGKLQRWTNNGTEVASLKVDGTFTTAAQISAATGIVVGGGSLAKKILSALAALDFGSIAAGATAELTISVTGAAVGDSVHLGTPASLEAGLIVVARVSAADTVKVRVYNSTSGAIDPASGNFRATVISY
jgi:hypothetical protein